MCKFGTLLIQWTFGSTQARLGDAASREKSVVKTTLGDRE